MVNNIDIVDEAILIKGDLIILLSHKIKIIKNYQIVQENLKRKDMAHNILMNKNFLVFIGNQRAIDNI